MPEKLLTLRIQDPAKRLANAIVRRRIGVRVAPGSFNSEG